MVILLRILLVLLPIILLLVWIRWRSKVNSGGEIPEKEVRNLRHSLIALVVAIIGVGVGLKMSDESGEVDGVYVPARVEDGKLIPGHFRPSKQEAEEPEKQEDGDDGNQN